MFIPNEINLSESLSDYIHFPDMLNIPPDYMFGYKDYISKYPYLNEYDCEVICMSILKWFKRKYPRVSVHIVGAPLRVYHVNNILRTDMVGHYINVDCVVTKTSEVAQEITEAYVKCKKCGEEYTFQVEDGRMELPAGISCPHCAGRQYSIVTEQCRYVDNQRITVQELQENTSHGKQPKQLKCVLRGDLVDTVSAGERVRLSGVLRLKYERDNFSSIFFEVFGVTRKQADDADIVLTDADIKQIKDLANQPDIYDQLANSLCPAIYGYTQIKKAIVFQIFGGTSVDLPDGTHIRGNSHILLCGDPALAKSQLIRAVAQLFPRSIYTSGKSSSGVGLTAAVLKDDDDKFFIQAGALPLADGGLAVIDELDKMSDEDRSSLHEAMEQQTITVNKAGISAQLYARCCMLAAANPLKGKFDRNIPLANQVDLPPSLMSRFDLVYLMTDDPDISMDKEVAKHILKTRQNAECISSGEEPYDNTGVTKPIDMMTLRKYLEHAKSINPIIDNETIDLLTEQHIKMRMDTDSKTRVTPRQLEALIRLSEASARIRLSSVVTVEDVRRAISLYQTSISSVNVGNEKSEDVWSSDGFYLSLIPEEGIVLQDYANEVMKRTLIADELEVNEVLLRLQNTQKISLKRIGTQTFVVRN